MRGPTAVWLSRIDASALALANEPAMPLLLTPRTLYLPNDVVPVNTLAVRLKTSSTVKMASAASRSPSR